MIEVWHGVATLFLLVLCILAVATLSATLLQNSSNIALNWNIWILYLPGYCVCCTSYITLKGDNQASRDPLKMWKNFQKKWFYFHLWWKSFLFLESVPCIFGIVKYLQTFFMHTIVSTMSLPIEILELSAEDSRCHFNKIYP